MKQQQISIIINKPLAEVFAFALDPKNTQKWIDAIVTEETNEWPPKIGTIYRSQNRKGEWRELHMTLFEQNKMFVLSDHTGFHIRYTFTPIDTNTTKLEFYIWMDKGELKNVFTHKEPEKLKEIIEANSGNTT